MKEYKQLVSYRNINGFHLFDKYLITEGKNEVKVYDYEDFELIGNREFKYYPQIAKMDNEVFIIRDGIKYYSCSYDFHNVVEPFQLPFENLWMSNMIENWVILKQAIGDNREKFNIVKYNWQNDKIDWQNECDSYRFYYFDQNYVVIDGRKSSGLFCFDFRSGNKLWDNDLDILFSNLYKNDVGKYEVVGKPTLSRKMLIVQLERKEISEKYVAGFDIDSGQLKWHHRGFNNFELYKNKIYSLGFDGNLRILNPETGILETEENLNSEFERMNVNCDYSFTVTDDKIYFKHGRKGKVGILNLENLNVEEVIQLPEGNTMSTGESPIPNGNRLYIRSAPQNNLFVYERE